MKKLAFFIMNFRSKRVESALVVVDDWAALHGDDFDTNAVCGAMEIGAYIANGCKGSFVCMAYDYDTGERVSRCCSDWGTLEDSEAFKKFRAIVAARNAGQYISNDKKKKQAV